VVRAQRPQPGNRFVLFVRASRRARGTRSATVTSGIHTYIYIYIGFRPEWLAWQPGTVDMRCFFLGHIHCFSATSLQGRITCITAETD
jgi:hypothetical protein